MIAKDSKFWSSFKKYSMYLIHLMSSSIFHTYWFSFSNISAFKRFLTNTLAEISYYITLLSSYVYRYNTSNIPFDKLILSSWIFVLLKLPKNNPNIAKTQFLFQSNNCLKQIEQSTYESLPIAYYFMHPFLLNTLVRKKKFVTHREPQQYCQYPTWQ